MSFQRRQNDDYGYRASRDTYDSDRNDRRDYHNDSGRWGTHLDRNSRRDDENRRRDDRDSYRAEREPYRDESPRYENRREADGKWDHDYYDRDSEHNFYSQSRDEKNQQFIKVQERRPPPPPPPPERVKEPPPHTYDMPVNNSSLEAPRFERFRDSRVSDEPTKSLVLKGLDAATTEETIADFIKVTGPFQEVRVIRNKQTGESRRFAFVEFFSIEDATSFLTGHNGSIFLHGAKVSLDYSFDKKAPVFSQTTDPKKQDWLCEKCNYKNFGWRYSCLTCHTTRSDDAVSCPTPMPPAQFQSNILMVRGILPTTTKDTVLGAFSLFQRPIVAVRFIKDKMTGAQRPFCFVEFHSIPDAQLVFQCSRDLLIDGQYVNMVFADPSRNIGGLSDEFSPNDAFRPNPMEMVKLRPPPPPPETIPPIVKLAWDAASGYYYDTNTGFYYDMASGLFYDGTSQQYHQYDSDFNMFVPAQQHTPVATVPQTPITPKPESKKKTTVVSVAAAPTTKKTTVVSVAAAPTVSHPKATPQKPAPVVIEDEPEPTNSTIESTPTPVPPAATTDSALMPPPPLLNSIPKPQQVEEEQEPPVVYEPEQRQNL